MPRRLGKQPVLHRIGRRLPGDLLAALYPAVLARRQARQVLQKVKDVLDGDVPRVRRAQAHAGSSSDHG
jgi:hypothetical protein